MPKQRGRKQRNLFSRFHPKISALENITNILSMTASIVASVESGKVFSIFLSFISVVVVLFEIGSLLFSAFIYFKLLKFRPAGILFVFTVVHENKCSRSSPTCINNCNFLFPFHFLSDIVYLLAKTCMLIYIY